MANSPYLTDQAVLGASPEVVGLERQRRLADLLTSQAFQSPQGQMISGQYVKPAITQQIQPLLGALLGSSMNKNLDEKQAQYAAALRNQETTGIQEYQKIKAEKGPAAANAYLAQQSSPTLRSAGLKELLAPPQTKEVAEGGKIYQEDANGNWKEVAAGNQKLHSVDGNLVNSEGKLIFKAPKVFAPHANQTVNTENGIFTFNPNTNTYAPAMMPGNTTPNGATTPGTQLMPPASPHILNERVGINQQKSIINDAIKGVENNRQYFGMKYAVPELLAGEFGQATVNAKLPENAIIARSQVFNAASAVIKERAGTAQSASERKDIIRFLPSPMDPDSVIIGKLNGYNNYMASKEAGTTSVKGAIPNYQGKVTNNPSTNQVPQTGGWKVIGVQ